MAARFSALWRGERARPTAVRRSSRELRGHARGGCLAALEREASAIWPPSAFSIGHIAIGCALGYLDFRFAAQDWRDDHPRLAALARRFLRAPVGAQATEPIDQFHEAVKDRNGCAIPLPSPETFTPEQRRVYDAIVSGPRGELRGPAARSAAPPGTGRQMAAARRASALSHVAAAAAVRARDPGHGPALRLPARVAHPRARWRARRGLAEPSSRTSRTRRPIDGTIRQMSTSMTMRRSLIARARSATDETHRRFASASASSVLWSSPP